MCMDNYIKPNANSFKIMQNKNLKKKNTKKY